MTVPATSIQIKLWKSKSEGQMHPDIKIQVSCDMKQSTLISSSTIFQPLTEVKVENFALTVNKLNLLTASFLQINHRKSELDGVLKRDIKIQVSYGWNQCNMPAVQPFSIL